MLKDFSIPEFNESGAMVRRLSADSARGAVSMPVLTKGRLEIFPSAGELTTAAGLLDFEDATYDRINGVLRGVGAVGFKSQQGVITARGFHLDIAKCELRLESEVVVKWAAATVKAATGVVEFSSEQNMRRETTVRFLRMSGGVIVTDIHAPKLDMDRIEAETAIYSAADGLLRVSTPVKFWRAGQPARLDSKEVQVEVGEVKLPTGG